MNAIIFGASGQDGFYLTKLLQEKSIEVIGISRSEGFLNIDIANFEEVSTLISNTQPSFIFHLAANSTTRHDALFENHKTIATGTLTILEAVKQFSPTTKVFISGSGLQFLNTGNPIKETDPFAANDVYSVSRIQSVYAARYFKSLGIKVYVGYLFNHDSPLRTERHVTKMICETVKRMAKGSKEKLEIGDMSVIKEWSFAGDIVNGIWLLIKQDEIFEANISNGEGHSIKEWIQECFSIAGISVEDNVVEKNDFVANCKILVSDNTVIKGLGYMPKVSFKDLAKMMMNGE
ncbi:MAG: GDP-mannose 4,6-dehydratase [Ferruginibacter sp.]|nr:GDP-mannose 4,6-dehydratase [Ferruginibacter sp.]